MKLIIIIPAYNEEATIEKVVTNSLEYSDVLVVDDGSSDQTGIISQQAGALVIKHDDNKGKGSAIKSGIEFALKKGYNAMVMLDGDGQHDPQFIPESINKLNGVDLVICSRFLNGPPQKMPIGRKLSNKLTTGLLRYTSGYHVTDSQCGFRAFSDKAARVFLDIPYDDYEFESEMLYQASLNSLTLIELAIPSSYQGEKSYITSLKIIKYIYYILKLLLRDLKRRLKY